MERLVQPIIYQIQEAFKLIKESGREPSLIVMNPATYEDLMDGFRQYFRQHDSLPDESLIVAFFGKRICQADEVKDFIVLDDRSWVEQAY